MSRSFLKAGIIITTLLVLDGLIYSYFYYQTDGQIWLDLEFRNWLIFGYSLGFIVTGILLFYFKEKNYQAALIITIIEVIVYIFRFITDYQSVGSKEIGWDHHASFIALQLVGFAFAVILIVTKASEQRYLKKVGLVICVYLPIVTILYIVYFTTSNSELQNTISSIFIWLEPIGQFIPIFYVLNFIDELKELPKVDIRVA